MFLKLAWRNIWRNKRRSIITMASIMFAVFFAVFMRSLQLGMYDQMIENVVRFYSGYAQVHATGYWEEKTLENSIAYSDSLARKIESTEGITQTVPRLESFALSSHKDQTKGVMVVGISPEKEADFTSFDNKVEKGEMITKEDRAVLIGSGVADYFNINPGDTLVLLGKGYHGISAAGKYPVKGIVKIGSQKIDRRTVLLPLKEAQWLYSTGNRITSFAMLVKNRDDLNKITRKLETKLDTSKYRIMTWQKMMPELVQTIQADSAGGIIMVFVLYLVISFGIFGTLLMMTAEREYEFGILISIGMKRSWLGMVMIIEIAMMAVLGVIAGLIFSAPFIFYFNANPIELGGGAAKAMKDFGFEPLMPTSTDPSIAATHSLIILGICIALAVYPIIQILKLKVTDAVHR